MPEATQLALDFEKPLPILTPDEIFAAANEKLLSALKEDGRLERKSLAVDPRQLGEYFSMWSNTSPDGGLIVLGISDDGTVDGCRSAPHKRLMNLEKAAELYCPDARYQDRRVELQNVRNETDFVLLYKVDYHKSKVVRTSKGDAFIRRADTKRRLSEDEIRELMIDKGQLDLELEEALFKYHHDFDAPLLREFAKSWMASRGVSGRSISDVLSLNNLGEVSGGEFLPNIACALLFAENPQRHYPGCKLRFLRFDGEYEGTGAEWNAVKDVWVDLGPIPRLIAESEKVIEQQLREFSRLSPDGKFYSAPEYPKDAWHEAVVNAFAHRSYGLKNMYIFVKMFDDRLVVESPGSFPPLVTPENIYEVHAPRNPRLMNALLYLDFVKCAHEGTRRMREQMLEMKLPSPEFREKEQNHVSVWVTLRNNIKQRKVWIDSDVQELVSAALVRQLSVHEKRAINFIAEHGSINVSQMQRLTGHSWEKSKKILLALVEQRILLHKIREVEGKGRDTTARFVLRVR